MFKELLNIVIKTLWLDNTVYRINKKNFDPAIYFALIIIIISIIIQTIPNNIYLGWMADLGLANYKQIKFRDLLFSGLFFWLLKSIYFYVIGKFIFPNKKIKFTILNILTITGFTHSPLLFNFLAYRKDFLFLLFITYVWYLIAQTIAINEIFDYKNKLKSFLIVSAPIWIPFIIIVFLFSLSK
tara:strand:- start:252 stop:803 length:552 start_codon:yes stop_codon:yes gene_type:complete